MNSANLNMLLWLVLAVVALVGKVVFEHFVTRAEKRKALDAAPLTGHVEQTGVKLAGRS